MAAKGIKVLAQKLTPQQEHEEVEKWWREEGAVLHEVEVSR